MLLSAEIQLLPDKTLFFQLGLFLLVVVSLNHLVFKPILKIIHLRRARTEGDRRKVLDLTQKTESLMKEYETKMQEAKQEALNLKETIRREGEEQGHQIVREAKQAGLTQIEKVKSEIAAASKTASKELEAQARILSKTLAEKVLGRPLN